MRTCTKCNTAKPDNGFYPSVLKRESGWCKKCYVQHQRDWRKSNRDKLLSNKRRYRTGVTWDQYGAMLKAQGGGCAICGEKESIKSKYGETALAVDHDHATGKLRGLLCSRCNRTLGAIEKNPHILQAMLAYLEHWK